MNINDGQIDTIEYLKAGNERQKSAYHTLTKNSIMKDLQKFDPILVGTIPISIDIENSDLDIICCYNQLDEFKEDVELKFCDFENFNIRIIVKPESGSLVANFKVDDFQVEIFGQNIPTKQQNGYRHMIIEYKLLCSYGESFRQKIIALKREGYKTEPAFAMALGLKGDPYLALLKFDISDL